MSTMNAWNVLKVWRSRISFKPVFKHWMPAVLSIELKETRRKPTAFSTDAKLCCFVKSTHGVKKSPCTKTRLGISGPEINKNFCQYTDDLYIHSPSYESLLPRTNKVFRRLRSMFNVLGGNDVVKRNVNKHNLGDSWTRVKRDIGLSDFVLVFFWHQLSSDWG
jgi:hypothetical protein